jgi:UDP-4-amino-4,6-dideoxy-N-acetyl-beta-L-altrosamine N-acetyltransferase
MVNVDNMAEIMANADIAIGAAGSTTWERCCLGLPAIQIVVAKNQSLIAELLARKNAIQYLQDISQLPNMLNNAESWIKNIGNVTAQICDGVGAYRVFNKITDYKIFLECFGEVELCNYVNLNIDEKILVLNMRNHPQIKKWMSNQDDIPETSHFNFIKNLENIVDQRYFLVKQHKSIVGSINFSKVDLSSSVEFGIYTNPFAQLKGAGSMLEAVASYYAFIELGVNKIKLEVFSNNERAIGFYKKCGFELINTKKVNHKDIFCMEKIRTLEGAQ